jgi:hypothetical protein
MSWFDDWFNDFIKDFRLKWQKNANKIINEAEEICVKEAIEELDKTFPGLPSAKIEAFIRHNYWKGMDYVKDKFDADWIKDT